MKLVCPSCGYDWNYTGELVRATCPSCGGKVPTREGAVEADTE